MSKKYIFRMAKAESDPSIRRPELVKYWAKDADGCEVTFASPNDDRGTMTDRTGGELVAMRHWCDEVEVRTRTRTRWIFSRDKWAEDLAQFADAYSFPARRWPKTIDGCVAWFDTDLGPDDLGTVYGPDGAEYEVHRSWCIAEEVDEDVRIKGN